MKVVIVVNNANGHESPMTNEQWESIKSDPRFANKYHLKYIQVPPEVEILGQNMERNAGKRKK